MDVTLVTDNLRFSVDVPGASHRVCHVRVTFCVETLNCSTLCVDLPAVGTRLSRGATHHADSSLAGDPTVRGSRRCTDKGVERRYSCVFFVRRSGSPCLLYVTFEELFYLRRGKRNWLGNVGVAV